MTAHLSRDEDIETNNAQYLIITGSARLSELCHETSREFAHVLLRPDTSNYWLVRQTKY